MNNPISFDLKAAQRLMCVVVAALLLVAGLPMYFGSQARAAQVANRSITMSDSAPSANATVTSGVGSGTNVTYRVAFDATVAAGSLVIDFCTETPLMDAVCTRPTGMDTTPCAFTAVTGQVSAANNWTCTSTTNGQILMQGDGTTDIAAGTQTFDLTGITNPSTVGTFFARVSTYANITQGTYSGPTSAGNFVDFGGIALSTVNVITITARVQEQMTFCLTRMIWSDPPNGWTDCSDPDVGSFPPAVVIGHTVNGIEILDQSAVDTTPIYSQISTNATNGAVVRIRNSNLACGGLSSDNGTTCSIPAHNPAGPNATAMTAGTAAFGLHVEDSVPGPSGINSLFAAAHYNAGANTYGMEHDATAPVTFGVTSTFGSTIATAPGPVYRANTSYSFAATASLTTPAGIYNANMSMIATGTF